MIKKRIEKLLELMEKNDIDAYIIPSSDDHQSEYVANYFKSRAFISGFTGSAGTVCITRKNGHGLWTDGRYFLQASNELKGSGIELYKMGMPGVKNYDEWLVENLDENSTIACDGKVFSISQIEGMKKKCLSKNIEVKAEYDLIDKIWNDRPSLPKNEIFHHELKYSGKTIDEKLNEVRVKMKENHVNYYILSSLDDIAWTFNLRGSDVEYNPVFLSYAVITDENAILYTGKEKISDELIKKLEESDIIIKEYKAIYDDVKEINDKRVLLSKDAVNYNIYNNISKSNNFVFKRNITTDLKAIKNSTEQENMKNCFARDGVAMVKFMKWLEENVPSNGVTEISAQEKLSDFRSKEDYYKDDSFGSISGYQSNGAIIHYAASEETCKTLKAEGFYLIDSGGQYLDGTTDITRTIALGELTSEQVRDYTLVLKGHIELSKVKFLEGTYGSNLDILARKPLWDCGFNYNHGTGHGVGYFLNVHEGPQRVARKPSNVILKPGMFMSNEPGIYRAGEYGIRLENLVIVKKDEKTDFGQFMKFENLTLCPFDLNAIDVELLDQCHIDWINSYHKEVYDKLSPCLNDNEAEWLKNKTREI